jgi:16S rRNA processing protein RimM
MPKNPRPGVPNGLVLVGRFGAPHGVRGEIRLESFTADPATIARLGPLLNAGGTACYEIRSVRRVKEGLFIARIHGVEDRGAAEALTSGEVYVPRDRLPAVEPDEFYHADLIGLRAETAGGNLFGHVVAVQNFGAGDLLEIAVGEGRDTVLLPFARATVPKIDLASGRLVIVPPVEVEAET